MFYKQYEIFFFVTGIGQETFLRGGTVNCRFLSFLLFFFCDTLRRICHIDFKSGSFNFHKQKEQPVKCQHLGISP